jgi:hypothetical protein
MKTEIEKSQAIKFGTLVLHLKNFKNRFTKRELSLVDRYQIMKTSDLNDWLNIHCKEPKTMEYMDKNDIPTKLITITHNNKTIESYEN